MIFNKMSYFQELINETRYNVTALSEGHEYQFRVCAENSIGLGERSAPSKTVQAINPVSPPTVPVNPTIIDYNETDVVVGWKPPRHDGGSEIIGYVVEMLEKGNEVWEVSCTQNDQKETKCTISNLKTNAEYYIRISAVNKAGPSEPAQIKSPVTIKVNNRKFWDIVSCYYPKCHFRYLNHISVVVQMSTAHLHNFT